MILVFANSISPRLKYVLDFCFAQKGFEYEIVTDIQNWSGTFNTKLNYSDQEIDADYQITPHGLLSNKGVDKVEFTVEDDSYLLDGVEDELSVIFFLLSRYEEYFDSERDQHDRYLAKNSVLFQNNLLQTPVVDQLVKRLWSDLDLDYKFVLSNYKFIPTFDIDVAWAFKHKGFLRNVGAAIKTGSVGERFKVMSGKKRDPYDSYSLIHKISAEVNEIICFCLLGDWSKYDKNIIWKNEAYQSLIRGLNTSGSIGIHPSYNSYLHDSQLETEVNRLKEIVGHEIDNSRAHFLRFRIPETYRQLEHLKIAHDYSMGYADHIGFRAGTSFSFFFFDLYENRTTNLTVHPFAYMDSALKDYMKVSIEDAKQMISELIGAVKEVGGDFYFIWHNHSINNYKEWEGWQEVLFHTLSEK